MGIKIRTFDGVEYYAKKRIQHNNVVYQQYKILNPMKCGTVYINEHTDTPADTAITHELSSKYETKPTIVGKKIVLR